MKILHAVQRSWPCTGGTEKLMLDLSQQFSKDHHDVFIHTTQAHDLHAFWSRTGRKFLEKIETYKDIPIYRSEIKYHSRIRLIYAYWKQYKIFTQTPYPYVPFFEEALTHHHIHHPYEIVHASALPYDSIIYGAYHFAKKHQLPFVITPAIHLGNERLDLTRTFCAKHHKTLLKKSNAIFTNTIKEKNYLIHEGIPKNSIHPIGPGIDFDELKGGDGIRVRHQYNISDPILLSIAAHCKNKGSLDLLKGIQILTEKGISVTGVFIGPPQKDFNTYFKKQPLTLQKKCLILGEQPESIKKDFLSACDIFIMPSITDSFGIVYFEAWYYKKPVIGAHTAVMEEIIHDSKDGFLVPFNRPQVLAKKVQELLASRSLRENLGGYGYEMKALRHQWKYKYPQFKDVYLRLLHHS